MCANAVAGSKSSTKFIHNTPAHTSNTFTRLSCTRSHTGGVRNPDGGPAEEEEEYRWHVFTRLRDAGVLDELSEEDAVWRLAHLVGACAR